MVFMLVFTMPRHWRGGSPPPHIYLYLYLCQSQCVSAAVQQTPLPARLYKVTSSSSSSAAAVVIRGGANSWTWQFPYVLSSSYYVKLNEFKFPDCLAPPVRPSARLSICPSASVFVCFSRC